jgi:hypothetical protein
MNILMNTSYNYATGAETSFRMTALEQFIHVTTHTLQLHKVVTEVPY